MRLPCLTNLFAFCIKTARSPSGKRTVGVICVDFSFQHVVLWHQLCLECCSLDGWTSRSVKTYQSLTSKGSISDSYSSWNLVTSVIPARISSRTRLV